MKELVFIAAVIIGLIFYAVLVSSIITYSVGSEYKLHGLDRPEIISPM